MVAVPVVVVVFYHSALGRLGVVVIIAVATYFDIPVRCHLAPCSSGRSLELRFATRQVVVPQPRKIPTAPGPWLSVE